jgi:hypothetical protein
MKIFFLILAISFNLFAFEDLGKEGVTYDIKEEDFLKYLESEAKKIDQTEIKKEITDGIYKASKFKTSLPVCLNKEAFIDKDTFTFDTNVYTPSGRLWKAKGTKMNVPMQGNAMLNLCYVDGSDLTILDNQIDFFKSATASTGGCLYLISNRSVFELYEKYKDLQIFPSSEFYENRFKVDCYPTLIHLVKDDSYTYKFNISEFNHKKEVIKK